jgi:hypothetical protein
MRLDYMSLNLPCREVIIDNKKGVRDFPFQILQVDEAEGWLFAEKTKQVEKVKRKDSIGAIS